MNRILPSSPLLNSRFVALAALVVAFFFSALPASAGCGAPGKLELAPPIPFRGALAPAVPSRTPDDDDRRAPSEIVGLWHVLYTATYSTSGPLPVPVVPPGSFTLIQSYKTWHADGTEFENAFLPPVGGNVCFGVWKKLDDCSVKLHHIGLMFAPDGSVANVFTVDEINRVAPDGRTYSGTFDFKIFPGTDIFGTGTPVQEFKGSTLGTRITVD